MAKPMAIRVYNSLSNSKEEFVPVSPGKAGIYLCGPTVYKPSHIGHAVGPVIFDAIKRYLVHRGYETTWVVNITDVDDKLIIEAEAQGTTVPELAGRIEGDYRNSLAQLQVTGIDHFPRASEYIGEIIKIIERLVDRGAAYVAEGDVYFDITSDDDYGKLSNRSVDDQAGQRELQSGPKRNPGDFALWKASKPEEPQEVKFDSPWGLGRPGWHIECSAMAMKILGETFDIHGGGLDLIFPHHENEIAQSETCTGHPFAKYWLHNGLTRFNTKKVSKSDPAMQAALQRMTLTNLLGEYSGELLRYFLLSTQYRRPIEYSPEEIESKRKGLNTFYRLFNRIETLTGQTPYDTYVANPDAAGTDDAAEAHQRFHSAMDDDFNTAGAIAALFELANKTNRIIEECKLESTADSAACQRILALGRELVSLGRVLGLFVSPPQKAEADDELVNKVLQVHIAVRQACRKAKSFGLADALRDNLLAIGITLEDKPSGTSCNITSPTEGLTAKLVDALLAIRRSAREAREFGLADMVRDELAQIGISLEDKANDTSWHMTE